VGPWVEREVSDHDILLATEWVQRAGIAAPSSIIAQAIEAASKEHGYHPVRDYLSNLQWDGTARIDKWLTTYVGAADTTLNSAICARWMIGAVARIFKPGCKLDTALILEGPQGLMKSSALKVLGDPWFTDQLPDIASKDALIQLQGVWILELAEMTSLNRSEAHRIKSFMTSSIDRFRVPHGKVAQDFPRQVAFCGTINPEGGYLKDPTGGRRFWPVRCNAVTPDGKIDTDGLAKTRDQMWAEAVARFKAGDAWWLDTSELEAAAKDAADDRYQGDAWDDLIRKYVDNKKKEGKQSAKNEQVSVSVGEVLQYAIGINKDKWTKPDQMRVGGALTALGWERKRATEGGAREWKYFSPNEPPVPPHQVGQVGGTAETRGNPSAVPPVPPSSFSSHTGESSGYVQGKRAISGAGGTLYSGPLDLTDEIPVPPTCPTSHVVEGGTSGDWIGCHRPDCDGRFSPNARGLSVWSCPTTGCLHDRGEA
jgi:putative DNA primase/helicase